MLYVLFSRSWSQFIINYINSQSKFYVTNPYTQQKFQNIERKIGWSFIRILLIIYEQINKQIQSTTLKLIILQSMIENKTNKNLSKQFPLEDVQYDELPEDKRAMVQRLLYLFVFYASKGSKHSYSQLPQHYFMQLLSDLWTNKGKALVKNKSQWKDVQLLYFSKGCKNSLTFKNFLELLPSIAIYAESDLSREDSLKSLMHHLLNVYQQKVIPQIDSKLINLQVEIDPSTRQFLSKLVGDLTKLYKLYFPHQVNQKNKSKKSKRQSFNSYLQFLKDFEVFPKIISARDTFYIFNQYCDSGPSQLLYQTEDSKSIVSQMGQTFKLSKFIQSLLTVSMRSFPKLRQVQNEQQWQNEQKYVLRTLLEYMQTAKTTNKKNAKFANERFCFIVLDQHPKQQMMKSIQVKDKIIKQPTSNMDFFSMMKNLKF